MLVVGIADVDCEGAVAGELVGAGAADAEGGIGAGDDDDGAFDSSEVFLLVIVVREGGELMRDVRTGRKSRALFVGLEGGLVSWSCWKVGRRVGR